MSTALLLLAFASFGLAAQTPAKPNVLYLMADDMRPNIGAYGLSFMQTPHLDKLANEGEENKCYPSLSNVPSNSTRSTLHMQYSLPPPIPPHPICKYVDSDYIYGIGLQGQFD